MYICVMANFLIFFILICGHIKKISHHYCVNIWTHIEKKVLKLELSPESTLIEPLKHKHWTKCHRKIYPFSSFFFTYTLLLFYYLKIQWILATIAYANTHTLTHRDRQTDRHTHTHTHTHTLTYTTTKTATTPTTQHTPHTHPTTHHRHTDKQTQTNTPHHTHPPHTCIYTHTHTHTHTHNPSA